MLARFHGQLTTYHPDWNEKLHARVVRQLDRPHRIEKKIEQRVHREIVAWPRGGARVVPTHGDWQPRNWLIDDGVVRVIDFGRADLRPAETDFVRLARQDFTRDATLKTAFVDGYGTDARRPDSWRQTLLAEAVGTAVWAYGVGDTSFEAFGHDLLNQLYDDIPNRSFR